MHATVRPIQPALDSSGNVIGIAGPSGTIPLLDSISRAQLAPFAAGYGVASGLPFLDFSGTLVYSNTGGAGGGGSLTTGTLYANAVNLIAGSGAPGATSQVTQTGMSFTLQNDNILLLVLDNMVFNTADSIRIAVSSTGFGTGQIHLNSTLKLEHGNKLYIPFVMSAGTATGGELITNTFNSIRVLFTNNSATLASVRVLGAIKNVQTRPKLIIDLDDGFISQYTEAYRYMAKYNLVGNVGVVANAVGRAAGEIDAFQYATLAQLQEMYAAGWDMTTHGYSSHASAANRAANLADVVANRNYLLGTGMTRAYRHYVLPGGVVSVANDTVGVLAEAGMLSARLINENPESTYPLGLAYRYGLWSQTISANSFAGLLAKLDGAINCQATYRWHAHRIVVTPSDLDNEISIANWQTLIDGVAARVYDGKIDVVTISKWAAACGINA